MVYCKDCGGEIPEYWNFCPECGALIPDLKQPETYLNDSGTDILSTPECVESSLINYF